MNKKSRRRNEILYPTEFQRISVSSSDIVIGISKRFVNKKYNVSVMDNVKTSKGLATRMIISSHKMKPIENHWSEIQKVKNELFGEETIAVEYYPKESELLDVYNAYWIWIFPEDVLPIPLEY